MVLKSVHVNGSTRQRLSALPVGCSATALMRRRKGSYGATDGG
jgi:hypothetical protein